MKKAVSYSLLLCMLLTVAISFAACSGPDPADLINQALQHSASPDSVEVAVDISGDDANGSINYYISSSILGAAAKSTIPGESFDEKLFIDSKQQLYHMQRLYGIEVWNKTKISLSEFTGNLDELKAVFSPDTLITLFSSVSDLCEKVAFDGTSNFDGTECYKINFKLKADAIKAILEYARADSDLLDNPIYIGIIKSILNGLDMNFYIGIKDKLCHGVSIYADNISKVCNALGIDMPDNSITDINIKIIIKYEENSLVLPAGAEHSINTDDIYSLFANSHVLNYLIEKRDILYLFD
ncbi:MAG: hypothetical protein GX764_06610 [Firmicutes bacterium]|nr:hypothetical protein [Bacillota bacterium]